MLAIAAQGRLERPGCFAALVLLEEELAPGDVGGDVGRRPGDRLAEEVVGLLEAAERAGGPAGAHVVGADAPAMSRDRMSESVRSASTRRPCSRRSIPSSTAASLIGFSATTGWSTFSASA